MATSSDLLTRGQIALLDTARTARDRLEHGEYPEVREWLRQRGLPRLGPSWGIGVTDAGAITIPIFDSIGLLGMATRNMNETSDRPKYMFNVGFRKSLAVYGLGQMVRSCVDEDGNARLFSELMVVEGFTDVWTAVAAGVPAVGVLGSSMSEAQALLTFPLCQRIVVVAENDAGGEALVRSVIDAGVRTGKPISVARVSEVLDEPHADICDVWMEHGTGGVSRLLAAAEPIEYGDEVGVEQLLDELGRVSEEVRG